MTFDILLCLTHMSNNNFAIPTIVVFVWIGTNFANLDLLTMKKMAFILSHFEKYVIKSINTFSKGPDKIEKALHNPILFMYQLHTLALHTSVDIMFYILFHFGPIESLTRSHSHGFSFHDVLP
jgi:hypothetical protein